MQIDTAHTINNNNPLDEENFHRIKSGLHNHAGLPYADFKKKLVPDYQKVWRDILLGWASLVVVMVLAGWLFQDGNTVVNLLNCFVGAILVGYIIAYLINFFHEATHYNIAPGKKNNDRLANMFIGILVGQGIKNYRIVHWQHHISLGTTEDTERSYFESLDMKFILSSLTGLSALQFLSRRNKFITENKKAPGSSLKKEKYLQLVFGIFFHSLILVPLIWFGQYWLAATWIIGVAGFYPFFNRLRQLIEHRSDTADKKIDYSQQSHGKLSRLFGNTMLDKTFGSAGFNKHMLHHLEPGISYTRMDELEAFLKQTSIGSFINEQQASYFKVFKKLLNQ